MRMFVVAGDPISHSLSPAMHNAAFNELGLDDCIYQTMRINRESLHSLISLLREGKIEGANLTYPLKEEVIPYLDDLSMDAKACGSVNTLSIKGDKLVGDTTDGEGCVRALASKGISVMMERVLLIGAGGAAKAVSHSIAKRGPKKLYIVNRTLKRAKGLVRDLKEYDNVVARPWDEMLNCLERSRILINCTTVGMEGNNDTLPVTRKYLDDRKIVMDIVYKPLRTELLNEAEAAGSLAINGLEMLLYQGAISFERWTGLKPPLEAMRTAIHDQLMVNEDGRSHSVNRVYG